MDGRIAAPMAAPIVTPRATPYVTDHARHTVARLFGTQRWGPLARKVC
jgi:hypothetical protein